MTTTSSVRPTVNVTASIDRTTPLGNPFLAQPSELSLSLYRKFLWAVIRPDSAFSDEAPIKDVIDSIDATLADHVDQQWLFSMEVHHVRCGFFCLCDDTARGNRVAFVAPAAERLHSSILKSAIEWAVSSVR